MIWLSRFFGGATSVAKHGSSAWLLDREIFQATLECERMRADRSDRVFSLMVISPREGATAPAVERLAEVLRGRIRRTDTAGWFDSRRVGVILPDTPAQGAFKLASDLSAFYVPPATAPIFDIYTHPADEQLPPPATDEAEHDDEALVETLVETGAQEVLSTSVGGTERRSRGGRHSTTAKFSRLDSGRAIRPVSRIARPMEGMLVQEQPAWKRFLDIFAASVGLALLAPLLALAALLIKLGSRGPIIFAQKREGLGGRVFTMYKFRTMCTDAEALKAQLRKFSEQDGPAFKLTNDPRITPLGHFLRKSCIDELPQLWNVLRGEMSLVGPRPLPVDESRNCKPWQRRRLAVKPGLTCIWQVDGGINVSFDQWMRMDLQYAASRTPARDARLIWKTFTKVLLRRASR